MKNHWLYIVGMMATTMWAAFTDERHPDWKFTNALFFISTVVMFTTTYVMEENKLKKKEKDESH